MARRRNAGNQRRLGYRLAPLRPRQCVQCQPSAPRDRLCTNLAIDALLKIPRALARSGTQPIVERIGQVLITLRRLGRSGSKHKSEADHRSGPGKHNAPLHFAGVHWL